MSAREPIAQVCLYGARETGYAYLASGPELSSPIVVEGGWSSHDASSPSGEHRTLSETIEHAKAALRALGVREGHVIVFFPGGERCAKTPVDEYEAVADMRLEPAPVVVVTKERIAEAGRSLSASTGAAHAITPSTPSRGRRAAAPTVTPGKPRGRRAAAPTVTPGKPRGGRAAPTPSTPPPLGRTSTGKPVPRVPAELGELEKAASEVVGTYGVFDPQASPAIAAAAAALRAHIDSYARDFTAEEHRDAARIVGDHKWATHTTMDRYLRYAHNGVESRHRRAAEALEEDEWRRGLR